MDQADLKNIIPRSLRENEKYKTGPSKLFYASIDSHQDGRPMPCMWWATGEKIKVLGTIWRRLAGLLPRLLVEFLSKE